MNQPCPVQRRLRAFLDGQLTPADEAIIEQHVDSCPECRQLLEVLTEDSSQAPLMATTADSLVEEPLTPRLRRNVAAAFAAEVGTFYSTGSDDPTRPEQRSPREDWPIVPGYEVTGMLGRGGLSIVYRAIDQRLKRPVALKIIRQQATPDERERLQREAEALATLRHPGVVQIYEIGEHQGRPFLALEFVAGGSLSRYLSGKAQPPRAAARLVATLAETMDLAHQRGLVHRDLKPANVLLHWENESRLHDDLNYCRPKVTDFGLVKNMSVESGLTHSRDLLGTPSYMAPEQAGGDPDTVGPACDIWALGAILYELMTGRPPFHGANAVDTLMQVRQAEPVPPSRLQAKLPRDLETICLKCLEKIPSQRYATAHELADDLHRFRDGQSIQARPVSSAGRVWRWCRRNPAVSMLSGLAVLLLIALAIGGPVAAYREANLRQQAADRAKQAEDARTLAGQNLDLATLALEETLQSVYERIGVRPDTLYDFDQNAWSATIPYLEQLVAQEATTPDGRLRKARAMRQLARSLSDHGDKERPGELFRQANAEFTELSTADPNNAEIQRDLGMSNNELGRHLLANPETAAEGVRHMQQAYTSLDQLVRKHPNSVKFREDLANIGTRLGERLWKEGKQRKEAREMLVRAAAIRGQLSKEFPKKPAYRHSEIFTLFALGIAQTDTGDYALAEQTFERALDIAKQAAREHPGDAQLLFLQNSAQDGLTTVLMRSNRLDDAKASAQNSIGIADRLANAFPGARQFAQTAWASHEVFRRVLAHQRDWPAAVEQAQAGLAINQRYREFHPEEARAKIEGAVITKVLAETLLRANRKNEAKQQFQAALALSQQATEGSTPADLAMGKLLAEIHIEYGELMLVEADAAGALIQFEDAISTLSPAGAVPGYRDLRILFKRALLQQAKALRAMGRLNEAKAAEELATAVPTGE